MTPTEIRIELLKRRHSLTMISGELNVTPAAVHRVIERNSVSERIMIAVANAIGRPAPDVFPEHEFKN